MYLQSQVKFNGTTLVECDLKMCSFRIEGKLCRQAFEQTRERHDFQMYYSSN